MIVVIDGYNLLKQLYAGDVVPDDRNRYITALKRYAKKKGHTIVVVFDGGLSDWDYTEKHGNILVIFSGVKQTADDVIMRYVEANKGKDLVVISADRQLVDHARAHNIVVLNPLVFDNYVQQGFKEVSSAQRIAQTRAKKLHADVDNEQDGNVDALMREGSVVIEYKDAGVPDQPVRRPAKTVLSKKERKIMNVLKKL